MLIITAGAPGTGKTFFTHELIKKWGIDESEILALDINHEFETDNKFYSHDDLIEAANSNPGRVVVFEEATSFFAFNNKKEIKRFFTTHRHSGNVIFANFHSLASIPGDLLMNLDYLYFTETVEKNPPSFVKDLEPYTVYSRQEILARQSY